MWPPPPLSPTSSSASRSSSRPASFSTRTTTGIFVYVVPKSYNGSVSPPECARVGEESGVREEEGTGAGAGVGLWMTAQIPTLHSLLTSGEVRNGGGAGGGGALSGSLSPRWPADGLGLCSRVKAGGSAGAQGCYAKDASATPAPAIPSQDAALSTSKSDVLSTEASSIPVSRGTSNTIDTSRSFCSLFLRTPSTNTNTGSFSGNAAPPSGVTPFTAGLTVPDSGYASSPRTGGGDVLFDYVEPPRDGEVVKVEIVETENGFVDTSGNAPGKTG